MFEESQRDMSQNLHQTQSGVLAEIKRVFFYICNYGNFGTPNSEKITAFLLIEIF